MKKKILIVVSIIVGVILLLGAGAAAGVGVMWGRTFLQGRMMRGYGQNGYDVSRQPGGNGYSYPGMMNKMRTGRIGRNGGMMSGLNNISGERLSMDQALEKAKAALSSYGTNLKISEIMEFENNFYVSVKETDTGKGAFELLVDPYSGNVSSEPGPNMMWNTKYGHMNFNNTPQQNALSVEQIAEKASTYLKKTLPAASLETDGTVFYGYVTFDYKVNGIVAGMLSVNSQSGQVWRHQWHGVFVAEKPVE
jgi:hypothetical protein